MFFSPSPRRRPQLQISERRLLIAAGDIVAVIAAVLIALRIWTIVAHYAFTLDFILSQSGWFIFLLALWLLLASANDFYDLRVSANPLRDDAAPAGDHGADVDRLRGRLFRLASGDAAAPVHPVLRRRLVPADLAVAAGASVSGRLGQPAAPDADRRRGLGGAARCSTRSTITPPTNTTCAASSARSREEVGQMIDGVPVLGTGADLMNFVQPRPHQRTDHHGDAQPARRDFSGGHGRLRTRHHRRADAAGLRGHHRARSGRARQQ